jgi:hypothetical protein
MWGHEHPALVPAKAICGKRVFDQFEAELLWEEGDGFIVITNDKRDVA